MDVGTLSLDISNWNSCTTWQGLEQFVLGRDLVKGGYRIGQTSSILYFIVDNDNQVLLLIKS